MTVDERGGIGSKEDTGANQFLDAAPAASWRTLFEPCREIGIGNESCVQRRIEITRRDGVALQPMLGPIRRHTLRQIADGALGCRIWRNRGSRQRRLHACDVDNLSGAALDHMTGDRLANIENARDVRPQKPLEGVGGKILQRRAKLHAGIVDENVDRPRLGFERIHGSTRGLVIGGIEWQHMHLTCKVFSRLGKLFLVAAIEHQFGASSRQALGERKPDTLGRTRHQGTTPFQIEKTKRHRFLRFFISTLVASLVYVIDNI